MSDLLDNKQILEREQEIDELRHAYGLLATSFPQARAELEGLASKGSVMSMIYLGHAYKCQGPSGYSEADKWYRMAYLQKSSSALLHLALMNYQEGRIQEAKNLWLEGVSKNDAPSMFWLASLYIENPSIKEGKYEIKSLLEKASALGQIRAKRRLAIMLMKGNFGILSIFRGIYVFFDFLISGFAVAYHDPASRRLW